MLNKILTLSLALMMSAVVVACDKQNSEQLDAENTNTEIEARSEKAADFSLKTTDGKTLKLSDYKNKIVILDFWATWCPPCRKGIPDLVAIQKEYKKDVVIIGISLDRENTLRDVAPFIKEYKINYPVVYGNAEVVKAYGGVQAIPTSFIIDKKGNVVDTHVGLVSKETYTDKIKSLLKK